MNHEERPHPDEQQNTFLSFDEDLVQLPTIKASGTSDIDFDHLLATPLKLHEDLKEGCGGQLWPAGVVLAKYMLRKHTHSLKDQKIVELGAGGGLVGLAVAKGCAGYRKPIYITDQKPMLELMEHNIELNNLRDAVQAVVYNWGEPKPPGLPPQTDIVLAADCVYFEPSFPLLQATLRDILGENTVCYFCFKKRRRADFQFIKTAKKMFDVTEVQDNQDKEVYARENIFLYEIRRKTSEPSGFASLLAS